MNDTSGFYKYDAGGLFFAPNFVSNKNYLLDRNNPPEEVVDGWKFYESQELAEAELLRAPAPDSITPRQARLALLQAGLLSSVNAALEGLAEPQKTAALIEWEYATSVRKDSPLLQALAPALNLTDEQIDQLFQQASTL